MNLAVYLLVATATAAKPPLVELPLCGKGVTDRRLHCEWLGFSPDGRWLAARYRISDSKARVQVWDRTDWGTAHADFLCEENLGNGLVRSACVFDPVGPALCAAGAGAVHTFPLPLRDAPRTTRLPMVRDPRKTAHSLALLADGKTLFVTTVEPDTRFRLDRCPLADPEKAAGVFSRRLTLDCAPAASPDGGLVAIATGALEGNPGSGVHIWASAPPFKMTRVAALQSYVAVLRFSPDGKVLATGCGDGGLRLHDVATGKVTGSWFSDFTAASVDFHPSRPLLVFATYDRKGNPNLKVVDLPTGKVVGSRAVDGYGTLHARFSPDGKVVATVGSEAVVRLWDLDGLIKKK